MQRRITREQPARRRRAGVLAVTAAALIGSGWLALRLAALDRPAPTGAVRIVLADAHEAPGRPVLSAPGAASSTPAEATVGAGPAAAPVQNPPVASNPARGARLAGVIALDYNLSGGAFAGDAIELDKPVSVDGADAGRIALRIDGNARVYAQGRRVAALLARHGGVSAVPEGLGDDFVSLEALRALGVDVRYDAARDRLLLGSPGA